MLCNPLKSLEFVFELSLVSNLSIAKLTLRVVFSLVDLTFYSLRNRGGIKDRILSFASGLKWLVT